MQLWILSPSLHVHDIMRLSGSTVCLGASPFAPSCTVRWPNFSRMRRRLENAPLLVGLKPRSKCSNQSFGRGASSYLCAVPRPTDQPLTTLSASKHDRPTDQRAVVGDFGWQLSNTVRKTGGANATQAAHAPWRDPRQTEITDGPSSPSAPFGGSYLTILRHLAAY